MADEIDSILGRTYSDKRTPAPEASERPRVALLRSIFTVSGVIVQISSLMTLTDGTFAWTGIYRRPLQLYRDLVHVLSALIANALSFQPSEFMSQYLPIALVFFVSFNIGFRQTQGHSFVWLMLVRMPQFMMYRATPISRSATAVVVVWGVFWALVFTITTMLLGPAAAVAPPVLILLVAVIVSGWQLVVLALALVIVFVGATFTVAMGVYYLLGLFVDIVFPNQQVRAEIVTALRMIWGRWFYTLGYFLGRMIRAAVTVWVSFGQEIWQAILYGPWGAAKSGLLRTQYRLALTVVAVFVLVSASNQILIVMARSSP